VINEEKATNQVLSVENENVLFTYPLNQVPESSVCKKSAKKSLKGLIEHESC